MYGLNDTDKIYKDKIQFYCPNFICTAGAEQIALRTKNFRKDYPIEPLNAVSTIGAGDNFNAGLIYGMLKYDVRYRDLNGLKKYGIKSSGMAKLLLQRFVRASTIQSQRNSLKNSLRNKFRIFYVPERV